MDCDNSNCVYWLSTGRCDIGSITEYNKCDEQFVDNDIDEDLEEEDEL